MAFNINTNINAMNALRYATETNAALSVSLQRLSSGLRINSAADDASGMVIADNLRSQKDSLGQAIRNANDAIGILQTADNAMGTQVKIVDSIRVKANQAAQDGQSTQSRMALQQDIVSLMEELDNIANTTTYNGIQLLDGAFTNKQFQIGAYSNETIGVTIGNTNSTVIGSTFYQTTNNISAAGTLGIKFVNGDNTTTTIAPVAISFSAGTGLSMLANQINSVSNNTNVRAKISVMTTGSAAVSAGDISNLVLNGFSIGSISNIKANDSDGTLINTINQYSVATGVSASIDSQGRLSLTSMDGRGIVISAGSNTSTLNAVTGISNTMDANFGRLTLISMGSRAISVSGGTTGLGAASGFTTKHNAIVNLAKVGGIFSAGTMLAAGGLANSAISGSAPAFGYPGVTTLTGAMMTIDIAASAMEQLDAVRSRIGSAVNQFIATINNISATQVNVAASESQIRDTDFAAESSAFSKYNILAQSGSYALSQANSIQQNILKLLQ